MVCYVVVLCNAPVIAPLDNTLSTTPERAHALAHHCSCPARARAYRDKINSLGVGLFPRALPRGWI